MENDKLTKSKILDKAQKLIAMMSSSNLHEVENASRLLQNLIKKYNLDEDMIHKIQEKIEIVAETETDWMVKDAWRSILSYNIAKFYNCRSYKYTLPRKLQIVFVGFETDRLIAKDVYMRLVTTIQGEAIHKSMHDNPRFINGTKFKRDFCLGAVTAIGNRLQELKDQSEKALVSLKDIELEAYMEKQKLKKAKKTKYRLSSAFLTGVSYGNQLNLVATGDLRGE